jgi:uncharacterized protein YlzI (FlbEa/FlbD family)
MIKLTWVEGNKSGSLIVPETVTIAERDGETHVIAAGMGSFQVAESYTEVAQKVLEYKFVIMRMQAALSDREFARAESFERDLLNGLEETQ